MLALRLGNAGAVVINGEAQLALRQLHIDHHALVRRLAGVVDQIAQQFVQVLLFSAKGAVLRLGCKFKRQMALGMQALHGAQQCLQRRQYGGAQPCGAHGSGSACTGQVVVHLAARRRHLLLHEQCQRAAFSVSSIGQDGQRRVHRVGQVAGLGAGALHHVCVLAQHVVELVDQRL